MAYANIRLAFDCVQYNDDDDEQQRQQPSGGGNVTDLIRKHASCRYTGGGDVTTTTAATATRAASATAAGHGRNVTALVLRYYAADHTIELHDRTRGRVRLQRTPSPLPASALVLGTTVVLHGRATTLTGYADDVTRQLRSEGDERATVLFAPPAQPLLGRLLAMFTEECGFVPVHVHMVTVPVDNELANRAAYNNDNNDNNDNDSDDDDADAALPAALSGMCIVGVVGVRAHAAVAAAAFAARCADELRRAGVVRDGRSECTLPGVYASRDAVQAAAWQRALCARAQTSPVGLFGIAAAADSTVVLLKPHILCNGHLGAVLQQLLAVPQLQLTALTSRTLTSRAARAFLQPYYGNNNNSSSGSSGGGGGNVLPDMEAAVHSLTGTVWAVQLSRCAGGAGVRHAASVVDVVRAACGPHDVVIARELQPRSVRARFGVDVAHNAVHCCDLRDDAPLYADYFLRCT